MKFLNVSKERFTQILHGKDGKSGMLGEVSQLNKIDRSKTVGYGDEDKVTTRENVYEYTGPKLGFDICDSVATINLEKAEEEMTMFIQKLSEGSVTTAPNCNPSVISNGVILKQSTVDRINKSVPRKSMNVIEGNCDNTFVAGTTDSKINHEKVVGSCSGNLGYSITLDGEPVQLNMISECNPLDDGGVTYGSIGYTQGDDKSIYEAVELLKRALIKYSKREYHSTVESVLRFVASFNEKTPEYEKRLGYERVLKEATMLYECGQL